MIMMACAIALGVICAAIVMTLYRIAAGPDTVNRLLALDTLVINMIAMIVLLGIVYSTTMYFETALMFAMVGFVTTVGFCKYLLRGNVIE